MTQNRTSKSNQLSFIMGTSTSSLAPSRLSASRIVRCEEQQQNEDDRPTLSSTPPPSMHTHETLNQRLMRNVSIPCPNYVPAKMQMKVSKKLWRSGPRLCFWQPFCLSLICTIRSIPLRLLLLSYSSSLSVLYFQLAASLQPTFCSRVFDPFRSEIRSRVKK